MKQVVAFFAQYPTRPIRRVLTAAGVQPTN